MKVLGRILVAVVLFGLVFGPNLFATSAYAAQTPPDPGASATASSTIYLPIVNVTPPTNGIHGMVTENGAPAARVQLTLSQWGTRSRTTTATTTTDERGYFAFVNAPTLPAGHEYAVDIFSGSQQPTRLWFVQSRRLNTYNAGQNVDLGAVDIAAIPLLAPPDDARITLPYTFRWTPRSNSSESYSVIMYQNSTGQGFWISADLGHVGSYTLSALPNSGLHFGDELLWRVHVKLPDGWTGDSQHNLVIITG